MMDDFEDTLDGLVQLMELCLKKATKLTYCSDPTTDRNCVVAVALFEAAVKGYGVGYGGAVRSLN